VYEGGRRRYRSAERNNLISSQVILVGIPIWIFGPMFHNGLFLPAPPYFLVAPPYTTCKYIFILFVSPHRITSGLYNPKVFFSNAFLDYIIWKLKKTSGLCNPKSNHASEKRFLDYIIQKLITNLKNDFRIM